ncbi:SRP40, C-terminal domain-domain-containing protein [Absidia repens]|uniref:SRP40, C-terminal domain-domain-containing protein n=1 Tax=Absidia repens TaxID=90262 RepID=A0A1X2ILF1_9FUNG|nr:SRP40, C-terminal domain-domain-containing protein [Absidia repens]
MEEEKEEIKVETIKRKVEETIVEAPEAKKPKINGKRQPGTPFQRVRPEEVTFDDDRLRDNTYVSKGGSDEQSYGWKAHQDLIKTRGDKFRAEKNKKKRGSYRGGQISMESHSIKFNFD